MSGAWWFRSGAMVLLVFMLASIGAAKEDAQRIVVRMTSAEGLGALQDPLAELDIIRQSEGLFAVQASPSEIKQFKTDPRFEVVGIDKQIGIFLQDAVEIVNASSAWNLSSSGNQITGANTSVCIIDTGVDANHSDLSGKVLAQYCYCSGTEGAAADCCPDGTSEDANATDNHGHGTHVAGIAAASGNIQGIAHGTNIVAVKVLNSSGVGFDSDLKLAIEWCTNDTQVDAHNISAISLSLGGGQYSSEASCVSADAFNVRSAINAANAKNISVVVSTGNTNAVYTNNSAGIASPACLANTTRVTASDKSDAFASYAFRHSNFSDILVAPGSSINSTKRNGGYTTDSGTSMAAPVVSGVIALLSQYLTISAQTMTPAGITALLNATGEELDDSSGSGLNFTRVDAYAALLEKDIDTPTVILASPAHLTNNVSVNQSFTCNATDWQLANLTFELWNASNTRVNNQTSQATGTQNQSTFTVTNLASGTYLWNCKYTDLKSNIAAASSNFTLTLGGVFVSLETPANNTYTNNNSANLSCQLSSETGSTLVNTTLHVWNTSNTLVYNETVSVSGVTNSSSFNYSFVNQASYYWNCQSANNQSNVSFGAQNYTITYDATKPNITDLSISGISTDSAIINWTTSENANASINASFSENNASYATNHSFTVTGLSSATEYSFTVRSCDQAKNCNTSTSSFTTSAAAGSGSGGGGGSGSGGGSKTIHTLNAAELATGTSNRFKINDKATFTLANEPHSLTVTKVTSTAVQITLQSKPINATFAIGQAKQFNLTAPTHYDLEVQLINITGSLANISIKQIFKPIPLQKTIIPNKSKGEIGIFEEPENRPQTPPITKQYVFTEALIALAIVIALLASQALRHKSLQRRKSSKNHGKKS